MRSCQFAVSIALAIGVIFGVHQTDAADALIKPSNIPVTEKNRPAVSQNETIVRERFVLIDVSAFIALAKAGAKSGKTVLTLDVFPDKVVEFSVKRFERQSDGTVFVIGTISGNKISRVGGFISDHQLRLDIAAPGFRAQIAPVSGSMHYVKQFYFHEGAAPEGPDGSDEGSMKQQ